MTGTDDRIRQLQEQIQDTNQELRIENAAEKDDEYRRIKITSAAVVLLILLLLALLLFRTFSPTGYTVVNDSEISANATLEEQQVLSEMQAEEMATVSEVVNETVAVNDTPPQNETIPDQTFGNETIEEESPAEQAELNQTELNITLNETTANETIINETVLNETINETLVNETVELNITTDITINETLNITENITQNLTENITNITELLNITNITINETLNQTNATPILPNTTEELPEQLTQGPARVGESVNWTKRIMVNWTGGVAITTYLPKEAEDITVQEVEAELAEEQPEEEQETIWEKWSKGLETGRKTINIPRLKVRYPILHAQKVGEAVSQEPQYIPEPESQTPAITGFSAVDVEAGDGLIARFLNWLGSLFGVTGAAVIEPESVRLVKPSDGDITDNNRNFLYRAGADFDRCTLYYDGFKTSTDELVLQGLNFFNLRGMSDGTHTWQVRCELRGREARSETWSFTVGQESQTLPPTIPPEQPAPTNQTTEEKTYYTTPEGLEFIEVNITDNVTAAPKVYEILYKTPAPEKQETVQSQYLKTVVVYSELNYTNITARTELPWVPEWLVKLQWLSEGGYLPVEDARLIDSNNDSLIEWAEWTVPHLSNQTYNVNLSYEIKQVNITNAEKWHRHGEFEEDATDLVDAQDEEYTELNKKYLKTRFQADLAENDTVSVFAWSNKDAPLMLYDTDNNTLSTATLKKGEWKPYNLTLTGTAANHTWLQLYSDNNVKYDYITAYDKKLIIPKKIIPPGNNITLVLAHNDTVDVTQTPQFEPASVTLKTETGNPVAEFDVYFENAELDIDLTGLVAETDPVEKKAVVHMDSWPAEISHEKTLYIPSTGKGIVYICPNATTIGEVNEGCAGKLYARMGENIIFSNETNETANMTVTEVQVDGAYYYKVTGITGTGGGESIEVLNVHSYPTLGGNWTVMFNTTGTANLTITAIENTTWAEMLTDDVNTTDDLEFLELECGNETLKPALQLLTSNGTVYNYNNLTANDSIIVESLFIENYTCNTTGSITNKELYGGHHALLFEFGGQNATAYNYVSQLSCEVKTKASCTDTHVLYLSDQFNAHAELNNQSNYAYSVCCKEAYGEQLDTNCSATDAEPILRLEAQNNSQVAKETYGGYGYQVCLSPSSYYNISCVYTSDCTGYDTCVASISSTESEGDANLHIGNCTGANAYSTKICCGTEEKQNEPTITSVILNATDHPYNTTDANLTAWPQGMSDPNGDDIKVYYNWYRNGSSITVLNLMMSQYAGVSSDDQTVYDVSGGGNHGQLGSAAAGDGAEPTFNRTGGYDWFGAYQFDGDNDYMTGPSPNIVGESHLTVEAWVKSANIAQSQNIASRNGPFFLQIAGSKVTGRIYNGTWSALSGDTTLQSNVWYHLVLTYDGTNMKVYVNGTQDGILAKTGAFTSASTLYIGKPQAVGYDYPFNGTVSDVKIYNLSLTPQQIVAQYYSGISRYNLTVSQETGAAGEWWNVSATPVDEWGLNGSTVWSNNVTISTGSASATAVDPLNAWVLNDTIKFECNATSAQDLDYMQLWHDYNGTWSNNGSVSVSGTYAEAEFNRSGMTEERLVTWGCYACNDYGGCGWSSNRTLTIDITKPTIEYEIPTSPNTQRNSSYYNWIYANVTVFDVHNSSAFIDFNRSLVGWWRFENNTLDSSTYGNGGTAYGTPELWTGTRGKAYSFDGVSDYITVLNDDSIETPDELTWSFWFNCPTQINNNYPRIMVIGDCAIAFPQTAGTTLRFWLNNGTRQGEIQYANACDETWKHFTGTWNGTHYRMYINGAPQGSAVSMTGTLNTDGQNLYISVSSSPYTGQLDEVMVWNRALSPSEINATYRSQLYLIEKNFTNLPAGVMYNFSTIAVDMAGNKAQSSYQNYSVNQKASLSGMKLNSTYNTNYTTENLTVWYTSSDPDGDTLTNITDWRLDGSSIAVLHMPFDTNRQAQPDMTQVKDYTTFENNGTLNGTGQLVDNGDAETGSTYNWVSWTGVNDTYYHSGSYSFYRTNAATVYTNEFIPIDITKTYNISGWFWSNGTAGNSHLYFGFIPYDKNFVQISNWDVNVVLNSQTTLYEDLDASNTTAKIVNGGSWTSGLSYLRMMFNVDDTGNYRDLPNRNRTTNGVQSVSNQGAYWLVTFYGAAGVSAPKGTKVREHTSGSTYMYDGASNVYVPNTSWTQYSGTVKGENLYGPGIGKWWPGTKYAIIHMLANQAQSGDYKLFADDITLTSTPPTYTGPTWNSSGLMGGAYVFDGEDDFILTGLDGSEFNTNYGKTYTIEAWVKVNAASCVNNAPIFGRSGSGSWSTWLFGGFYCVGGNVVFAPGYNGSSYNEMGTAFTQNKWHHLVGVCDNSTSKATFYKDGSPVGSVSGILCANYSNSYTSNLYSIGASYYSTNANFNGYFNGSVDSARLYNRSLTADQVLLLYQNQSDKIHFNETSVGENWSACVTPNDGLEDGTEVCSNNLTVTEYTVCRDITSPGTYSLTENAYGAARYTGVQDANRACIAIYADNVTFSCNGYNITNDGTTNAAAIIVPGPDAPKTQNVTIKDCTGISGYSKGIYFHKSENNKAQNITVYNSTDGIYAYMTTETNITNSSVYNSTIGFRTNKDTSTRINASMAYNNSFVGFLAGNQSNVVLTLTQAYANMYDLIVNNTGAETAGSVTLNNMTFKRPTGSDVNSTTLVMYDSVAADHVYSINWTAAPTPLPPETEAFNSRFVEITDHSFGSDISSINWSWQDGELIGYDEDYFELWKYSSGEWTMLNNTPDTATNTLSLTDHYPLSKYGVMENKTNRAPSISTVELNATDHPLNRTTANLTAWPFGITDPDSQEVKIYYNWYINGTSITVLNLLMSQKNEYSPDEQTVYDISGYGNNAELGAIGGGTGDSAEPTYDKNDGYDGFGVYIFDGIDDRIIVPHDTSLNFGNRYSIEFWFYPIDTAVDELVYKSGSWEVYKASATQIYFRTWNSTAQASDLNSGAIGSFTNNWHHVVAVFNRGTKTIYVDGSFMNSGSVENYSRLTSSDIGIGSYTAGNYFFNGTMSDIKLYNISLTQPQVESMYYSGIGRYNLTVSNETVKNQQWNVSATPVDFRGKNGTTVWSNQVIIRNTPPAAPTLLAPSDGNITIQTRFPTLNWTSAFDADGDAITYKLNITRDVCGADIVYTGLAGLGKTVEEPIQTYDECNQWNNWTVTANDGEAYGTMSSRWGFKIMPIILFQLGPATTDFGNKLLGEVDDTTDDTPLPMVIENRGTVTSDILNITADTNLWSRAASPTDKFQVKVSDNETGSINLTGSATDWTDISLSNVTIIRGLNSSDASDSARIDFRINVPLDEPPGVKTVQLTFYGVQT